MRRPEWLRHPNGATGIRGIHVLVNDTAALLEPYDRLFGIQQVATTDGVVCIHVGGHRIVFSTPDDFRTMNPALDLDPEFPLPGIVGLELSVARREETAEFLERSRIAHGEMADGSFVVPASEATGAILFLPEPGGYR